MYRKGVETAAVLALCLVGAMLCAGCGRENLSQYIPPPGKYDVRILRDEWGVPHIFGKHDADAAYGLAYAHCEDDWVNFEDALLLSRAKLASVKGKDWGKFDYLVQLFRVRQFVDEKYEKDLSPDVRAVLDAYADGINHFVALNRAKMPDIELPVTGKDIVVGASFKAPFFYELQRQLLKIFGQEGVNIDSQGQLAMLGNEARALGSNAWAIAPARSADGATRIAINSHMPWSGPVTWYEAHVHSEDGWNVIGATFPCGPMLFIGHDENKAWTHTINRPHLADIYKLDINPANANQYKLDGQWRDFERGIAHIKVKLWGPISWTFNQEMLWSVHGPAFRRPDGVYALRFVGYGEIKQLEQWFRMNKARNLDEFRKAMHVEGLLSLNTVYADKSGNIFYAYVGKFPVRPEGYDWKSVLPGDTSKDLWTEFYPFDKVPQVLNPPSGFIQSCNSSPYHTTDGDGNPRPDDFPAAMGIETGMTNRSLRALETYGADKSITHEKFYAYKYDKKYSDYSAMGIYLDKLFQAKIPDEPLLQEAVGLLKKWDHKTDKQNTLAALGVLAGEPYRHWHGNSSSAEPDVVDSLRQAAKFLKDTHGALEVPWEQVLRLRRGSLDLGLGGGPDCLRCIEFNKGADGTLTGSAGDCYFMMVEWGKDGTLHSEAIHQYGAATVDAASPHYADQAPLFAAEKMRPTLLTEADIRAHLEREYRPGAIPEPWYK